jgi:hypothetical protein
MGTATTQYITHNKDSTYTRDLNRVQQFDMYMNTNCITSNNQLSDQLNIQTNTYDSNTNKHITASWSRRGALQFHQRYQIIRPGTTINYIFLDYFRMPCHYITSTALFTEFLPQLKKSQIINHHTNIIVPNQPNIYQQLIHLNLYTIETIFPQQNQLYQATNLCSTAQLCGYTNQQQIDILKKQIKKKDNPNKCFLLLKIN